MRILFLLLSGIVFFSVQLFAQEASSPKPGITVNGGLCLIGNTIYSCVPKTCSSVTISAGDSIEFCTAQQISLGTDTAYYVQWDFNGSSNYPFSVFDAYPTVTPLCRYPIWTTPGNYTVDVFYNGWLSAYPNSDCYSFGPSHWIINVTVSPVSVEQEATFEKNCKVFPNPGEGLFTFETPAGEKEICVKNVLGQTIIAAKTTSNEIDLRDAPAGIYFLALRTEQGVFTAKLVKE